MDKERDDSHLYGEEVEAGDGAGAGRAYYECMFCKQGFTNAQALGGHMNIHRRDRAKYQQRQYASAYDGVQFASNRPAAYSPVSESLKKYPLYFSPATPAARETRVFYGEDSLLHPRRPLELDLSLRVGHRTVDHEDEKMREDGDLDLELRLGHWPY